MLINIAIAYLLGSINFSYLLPRIWRGIDIRQHGSGNAGATNAMRALGWKFGLLTGFLDVLKGVVAVNLGCGMVGLEAYCAAAVICGHNWPVFFGFKGGKGIATTIGITLCLASWTTLFAIAIGILVALYTRQVFLGSLVYVALFALLFILATPNIVAYWMLAVFLVVAALWSHRSNLIAWRSK